MKKILIISSILFITQFSFSQTGILDVSGYWHIWLDPDDSDFNTFSFNKKSGKSVQLPATLDELEMGRKTTETDKGRLTRKYRYIGAAWYEKNINIPADWNGKNLELFLERVMWKSDLWVDGKYMGSAESLGTPHKFQIGDLNPGKHTITLKINNDMIYNIGDVGHTYTDYTQTKWNGILGRMEMLAFNSTKIEDLKIFPNFKNNAINIDFKLNSQSNKAADIKVFVKLIDKNTGVVLQKKKKTFKMPKDDASELLSLGMKLTDNVKGWSEFDPYLYDFEMQVISGKESDRKTETIGFRDIEHSKTKIIINDTPAFMRGNLNNAEFPLTGYPPTNVEEWTRLFKIHQDYGLNHVRFHSWCPPEAAFIAADRLGVYLQVETLWIAQWMRIEGRAKTAARPEPLGEDPKLSKYIEEELNRIVDVYGNHPSFTFFCVGNELDNGYYNDIQKWLDKIKIKDGDRRLYSLSASWDHAWKDQYKVTGEPYNRFFRKMLDSEKKDLGYPRFIKEPHSNWDFEALISQSPVPLIVHEIGQQAMYPLWSQIEKYKGVLEARNYMKSKESAIEAGIYDLNKEFSQASGKLAQLLYKEEMEGIYRTPSNGGFELLGMQDFPGQGVALVGWLDAFYDSKGVTTPEEFKHHNDTTVVLMRTNSYIYQNTENLKAKVQLHHFGQKDTDAKMYWNVSSDNGIIDEGTFIEKSIKQGSLTDIDSINISLKDIKMASKVNLEIGIENSTIKNSWDFWVYPESLITETSSDVFVTSELTPAVLKRLNNGQKVILVANELGNKESSLQVSFNPLYWSLSWIPNQATRTLGTYIRSNHPALKTFPTDDFTGMQWQSISRGGNSFYLDNLPKKYQPIVQPIYDFHESRKVGSIFELKVGEGKLLVCGYDITNLESPVARQLRVSLMDYVKSSQFNPKQKVSEAFLSEIFKKDITK